MPALNSWRPQPDTLPRRPPFARALLYLQHRRSTALRRADSRQYNTRKEITARFPRGRETARSSTSPYTYESRKSLSLPGFAYRPLAQTVQETAQQFLASQAAGRDWAALPV